MEQYDKPFRSYEEQISYLQKEHHLIINDDKFAKQALQTISYYDIVNGYKECMMVGEYFKPNITIEFLYMFYLFDKGFQDILFRQIMFIENYFKTILSYTLAKDFGVHQDDYLNSKNYIRHHKKIYFSSLKEKIVEIYAPTKKGFIPPQPTKYYVDSHNHVPPWILFKNISFSNSINLFQLLRSPQKSYIVNSMVTTPLLYKEKAEFLLDMLNILRNFRNKTAHNLKFVTFKDNRNYLSLISAKKVFPPYMLSWPDLKIHHRGLNDLYASINSLLLLISTKDLYLVNRLCDEIIHYISPINESQNEQVKISLFKEYAAITNIPNDLSDRLTKYKSYLLVKHYQQT